MFLFCILHMLALSGQAIEILPETQLSFADALFEKGHYFRSIQEYERFIHFFPDHEKALYSRFQTGEAYFQMDQTASSIQEFTLVADTLEAEKDPDPEGLPVKAFFRISKGYMRLNKPDAAVNVLGNLIRISKENSQIQDKARFAITRVLVQMGRWEDAQKALKQISPENRTPYQTEKMAEELDKAKEIKQKNAFLAGVYSMFPGLGYVYTGRFQDAFIAFFINAALGYAMAESFEEDLYALGFCMAILETGFYTGTIYGSVLSAQKYNQRQKDAFQKQLLNTFPYPEEAGKQVGLFFSISF